MFKYEKIVSQLNEVKEQKKHKVNEAERIVLQINELNEIKRGLKDSLNQYKKQIYIKYSTRAIKKTNPVLLQNIKSISPSINSEGEMYLEVTTLSDDKFTITRVGDVDGKEQYKKIAEHIFDKLDECCGPIIDKLLDTNSYFENFPKALTFMLCISAVHSFPKEIAIIISDKILF